MSTFSQELLEKLATAKSVGVLTGAGISVESGIATFRGHDGIWKKFKPEELASMDAFLKNPELVWEWYEYRRQIIYKVKPNPAHFTLAEMESCYPEFTISTQNVDGLHALAGSKNILELHGNILYNRCNQCGKKFKDTGYEKGKPFQYCNCGGKIRPDVVWFGEPLPAQELEKSFNVAAKSDVYFSIGTSANVYPAAMLPVEAKLYGAYVIEINLEKTTLSGQVDVSFLGKAGEILPEMWQAVQKYKNKKISI
ncbi:NAD-dependent deacylase [candidate division KSB1 bacterium]|nr:NAD-dependent deacylase [candidate division KSB1 bacterium]